ncbi:phosphatase [Actibacterium mucosum KCTC 23349]|uniref:phosphoglycolate phosphatase n=1 Tax=Actibacterium mucosum KCTC 23349 TaxID=1454373 RepID=A0A037ZGR9_9RHOB|nr:phosphatase [Actibacterium mucosum KCTC 23349]
MEGIIFDKDGTLFDFQATWNAWAMDFLSTIGGGDAQRIRQMGTAIGFDVAAQRFAPDSPAIAGTPSEVASLLLPFLPGSSPAALVMRMNRSAAEAPMQEATPLQPLLSALIAGGVRLGVATNDAEAPAKTHLQRAGIIEKFEFVAGCDSGFGAKPATGQLLAFADLTGIHPGRILMVGDSRHDLLAGRAAGMGTVGVLTGLATAADLADLADIVLPDIGHLPGYLSAQAA